MRLLTRGLGGAGGLLPTRGLTPAAVAPSTAAPSLLEAVIARVYATPALIDALPGGFHFAKAPDEAFEAGTWGVLAEVARVPRHNTRGRLGYDARLQVSLFGPDAKALHDALRPAFLAAFDVDADPLLVEGEYVMAIRPDGDRLTPDVGQGPDGRPLYHQVLLFAAQVGYAR